jgi:hypothetical protein
MLEADFEGGEWKNIEIKPYQPFLMSPSAAVFHYGQAIFEGIKAYKIKMGKHLFSDHMIISNVLISQLKECKCQLSLKSCLLKA